MLAKKLFVAAAAGALLAASGTAGAAANFDNDVAASIDKGLAWFDAAGCYGGVSGTTFSCGDATGLAALALLEKRPSAGAAPQGYEDASPDDQARMRRTIGHIITSINSQGAGFYAYRDGAYMMALSVYMRSGGPEISGAPLTLKQALDKAFDRTIANQRTGLPDAAAPWPANNGYWCYTNSGCRDSSTTQLVVAGLAAARGVYNSNTYADAARGLQLDSATKLARNAYRLNGTPGGACGALPGEEGHGYNAGSENSIQQTASGLWIQLVGGSGLNWPDTQAYLRWLQHRYRWGDTYSPGFAAGWSASYWYYLWSSYKAYQFMIDGQYTADPGNIDVADIGKLPATDAPACAGRQVHRDPDALPRIALFGSDGAGYYGEEEPRIYFDYAYTIMGHQCPDGGTPGVQNGPGYYGCNSAPGRWDTYAEQAYALLVLQRSVGGGCIDIDRDGICDANEATPPDEPPVEPTGGLYCDKNANGSIDDSDIRALGDLITRRLYGVPVTSSNAWANYMKNSVIDRYDYEACVKVQSGRLAKKYY